MNRANDTHGTVRLFVDEPLAAGLMCTLTDAQSHYVGTVMRRRPGDHVFVFNGRDGEWHGEVTAGAKRSVTLRITTQTQPQTITCPIALLFAPLKRARNDLLVEKATELGVTRLQPVLMQHAVATRVNAPRMRATAIEAAEQAHRLDIPVIDPPRSLAETLQLWDPSGILVVCDTPQRATCPPLAQCLTTAPGVTGLMIGPEGGFAAAERDALAACPFVRQAHLGPRILRAETAAIAALAVWQSVCGNGAVG